MLSIKPPISFAFAFHVRAPVDTGAGSLQGWPTLYGRAAAGPTLIPTPAYDRVQCSARWTRQTRELPIVL